VKLVCHPNGRSNKGMYEKNYIRSFIICTFLHTLFRWSNQGGFAGRDTKFLVGNPQGKTPLGRPRRTWEDNIKMNIRQIREGLALTGSEYSIVGGFCVHDNEPS
jgi:hypothetical protein